MLPVLPITFKDTTESWLKYLPPDMITTWDTLKKFFLQQFNPSSKIAKIKAQIHNFQQNGW